MSTVPFTKLTVAQLVKKLDTYHIIRKSITTITSAFVWTLPSTS